VVSQFYKIKYHLVSLANMKGENNMERRALFIPEELYDLNKYNLLVYLHLQEMTYKDETRISTNVLIENITKEKETTKKMRTNILNALNYLINNGIVDGIRFSKCTYIIRKCSFTIDKNSKFVIIYFDELEKINNVNLLHYFIMILSTISNKLVDSVRYGNMSIQFLSQINQISINTIIRYNQELQDLKLIYIRKPSDTTNTFKNLYCRYQDKKYIDILADDGGKYGKSNSTNWQRSVTARYNAYVSGKSFSEDDIQQLYDDCVKYNELMDRKQKSQSGKDYINKKKDLSVFRN